MRKDLLFTCLALLLTGCGYIGEVYKKEADRFRSDVRSLQADVTAAKGIIPKPHPDNAAPKDTPAALPAQVRRAFDR